MKQAESLTFGHLADEPERPLALPVVPRVENGHLSALLQPCQVVRLTHAPVVVLERRPVPPVKFGHCMVRVFDGGLSSRVLDPAGFQIKQSRESQ